MQSAFQVTSPPLLLAGTNRESLTATGLIPIIDSEIESIKEFDNNNSLLTQSQQTRLQLYLGNFNELKDCLDKLIVINVENPVQLQRLFNLWEKIVNAIAILSQYSQNECKNTTESNTQEHKTEETETINDLVEEVRDSELDEKLENTSIHNSQMLRVSQINDIFLPNFDEEFDLQEEKKEEIKIEPEIKPTPLEFDCLICGDILPGEEMFTFTTCAHNYCKGCLVKYITVKIESGEVRKTCCPDLHCGIDICEEDIEQILPSDLFGKFQRFLFFDRLRENENARWCPKPNCDFAIIVDDTIRYSSSFPKLTCAHCETEFCFDCSEIWHEGAPCYQAKDKSSKKELAKINKWKKKHSQPCRKCHANVEKSGGCNHMTCRCGYQWCWICGDEYQWQHYYEGKCKGLHVSEHPGFDKALIMGKKAGKIGVVGAGVVIATPVVVGAGLVALGLAIPVACVAIPIGGAYYIKKKRNSRKNRWART